MHGHAQRTKKNMQRDIQMKRKIENLHQNPTDDDAMDGGLADSASEEVRRLRPLMVLEHLTQASHPLSLAQLAGLMKVPKSTLMRLLHSMEAGGYVLHLPAERGFVPGSQTTALALRILQGSNIRRDCRAVLRTLVNKLGETCNLTVPDAGHVLYVERVETSEPLRMHVEPGTRVPMHCTASGKLFLASMPLLERRSALDQLTFQKMSPNTITDRARLEQELQIIARKKMGVDNEEFVRGMIAVAAPVMNRDMKLVAAIACHAPTARMSLDEMMEWVPRLRQSAEAISAVLFPE
jgi:DNA-binding IclR family transcriptional regulator